jgi:2-polyprenyl-3-methyl-5-hydroxy-6-metoxy-1,4-benzoquinol methylase
MTMPTLPLGDLAFYWRMTAAPATPPNPVPDFVEFEFSFLEDYQLIIQTRNQRTWEHLERIYRENYNVGYLQEGHALAAGYGGDFMQRIESAISQYLPGARRISEIGAGGSYILKQLKGRGFEVAAIDPSPIAIDKGREFGIEVVPRFYPAPGAIPKSDLILHYDVLEHVPDPVDFLRHHPDDLNPGGITVFAVPDCTPYIASGDVSMILHEHLNYYDAESLRNVVEAAGFDVLELSPGGYGNVLFCVARVSPAPSWTPRRGIAKFEQFAERVRKLRTRVEEFIRAGLATGHTLGCYVPLRAVPYLSMLGVTDGCRFFDDNGGIHGQYFDGFSSRVESQQELAANPVTHLLIMSYAFGDKIRQRINDAIPGHGMNILTLADLAHSADRPQE